MKRDSVSAYVHMKRDTHLPLYEPVHILDDHPSFPQLRSTEWMAYLSMKKHITTFKFRID